MHLQDDQLERFLSLVDGITLFAVAVLRIMRSYPLAIEPTVEDVEDALIAGVPDEEELCEATRMLWSSPPLIDEYTELNPFGLGDRDLATVAPWKDALQGSFVLVGFDEGCALLLGHYDLFALCGLERDPQEEFREVPAVIDAALVPFEGRIVSATGHTRLPMGTPPVTGPQSLAQIVSERVKLVRERGIVRGADEFATRSQAARTRAELERLEQFRIFT